MPFAVQTLLDPETLFWRLHLYSGASVFTMASSTALRQIAENDFACKVTTADLIDRLVPYLAAGVAAPIEQSLSLVCDEPTGTL